MRKTARLLSQIGPEERLAAAISQLPSSARRALADVADREDLPLVAGMWDGNAGGCLVANVVRASSLEGDDSDLTLDLRVLELFPELSSRDLNHLIVAWDEAAAQEGRNADAALRRLLRGALARAGALPPADVVVPVDQERPGSGHDRGAAPSVASRVSSSLPRTTVSETTSPGSRREI